MHKMDKILGISFRAGLAVLVMLNLFQHPSLIRLTLVCLDPETSSG